jgi:hypothetical protein
MGEAKLLEELSDIAWMKVDAEPLGDDALEVEPTTAHDAVDLTIQVRLDDLPGPTSTICATGPVAPPKGEALDLRSNCREACSDPKR